MKQSLTFGLLATALLSPSSASAFAEDVVALGGSVGNCLSLPADTTAVGVCNNGVGRRSTVHVDATYAIAVALGFREDIAHFITAYSEVTDETSYTPFDRCGKLLVDPTRAVANVDFDGVSRSNTKKGGLAYHFMVPFAPSGRGSIPSTVTGVMPFAGYQAYPTTFTLDRTYEGTLSQLRTMVMGGAPVACVFGFASPVSGTSYFTGTTCWPGGTVSGIVPLTSGGRNRQWSAATGTQMLEGDVDYASLQSALDQASGELWLGTGGSGTSGKKVPAEIARLGFYLHALQDRISHAYCGDSSYATASGNAFQYSYSVRACTNANHNTGHFYEVGQATGQSGGAYTLPLRDFTALQYAYDELKWFKETYRSSKPAWFKSGFTELTKDVLIGTATTDQDGATVYTASTAPVSITAGLAKVDATARVTAIQAAITAAGRLPMPGYEPGYVCP
ncbi:MAG: hypothetical protein U0270_23570 [Labilithrix sp.]